MQSGQSSEMIFAAKELPWHQSEHKTLLLEVITHRDPRLRFAFLNELIDYIVFYYSEPKEFETIFQSLTNAIKDPNPHVRRRAIEGIQVFFRKGKQRKDKTIDFLTKVFQEDKDPLVAKQRILYHAHIWGKDPESITLAPEFR